MGSLFSNACFRQTRPIPSPAFNQDSKRDVVYPLQNAQRPELDDSFVGLSGGEIFHEMMLRQGVKHVYMSKVLDM
ncbi:MAG: hypothetical protein LQ351_003144 [Letrouitia transgressa]|nr:MAG: hypothetical protein LQ351_003144 [Letrouitia transgressa]